MLACPNRVLDWTAIGGLVRRATRRLAWFRRARVEKPQRLLVAALLMIGACAASQSIDRPTTWPSPIVASSGQCSGISGRYKDSPVEERSGNETKYLPSSLTDLLAWHLWGPGKGPLPIVGGKATVTDLSISSSGASASAKGPNGLLTTFASTESIRCEDGFFVFQRRMVSGTEGTTSDTMWRLDIAVTPDGTIVARASRAVHQRSMLVLSTVDNRDRWYRFAPSE